MNSAGEEIKGAMSIQCPKGWEWEDKWCVDTRRACDEDGEKRFVISDQPKKFKLPNIFKNFTSLSKVFKGSRQLLLLYQFTKVHFFIFFLPLA